MAQEDVVDSSTLGLVLAVGALLTVTCVIGVQALYFAGERHELNAKQVTPRAAELTDLHALQRGQLEQIRVVDKDKSRVSVPIDLAMEIIRKENAKAR